MPRASRGYGHVSQAASPVEEFSPAVLLQEQVGHQLGEREKAWLHPQPVTAPQGRPVTSLLDSLRATHLSSSLVDRKQNREFSSVGIQGDSGCRGGMVIFWRYFK